METRSFERLNDTRAQIVNSRIQLKKISSEIHTALANDDQQHADYWYSRYFRLAEEYLHLTEVDLPNLESICKER